MTVMATLERIRPSTIVMPSPMIGRKEKKPIHAPRPAMNRLALSSSFFVHVQVFFNPVYASEHADAIVEHASEHVAYCAVNNQLPRVESGSKKRKHNHLAAQGEYAARKECRNQHSYISVVCQNFYQGIHKLYAVSAKVPAVRQQNVMFVSFVFVSAI